RRQFHSSRRTPARRRQRGDGGDLSAHRALHHRRRDRAHHPIAGADFARYRCFHRQGAAGALPRAGRYAMTALVFLAIVVAVSVSLAAIMSGAWLAWRSTRNSGWIDTTWTFGRGAVGCAGAFTPSLLTGGVTTRQVLVA